ncbi:MAG: transketolase family protein [Candidatus Micrarchaeota archaeon]|nr:transketolase family protein [Candidatus Micrarchaeota archaeon]
MFELNPEMNLEKDIFSPNLKMLPTRDGWGKALEELGAEDENICVLTADLSSSVRTEWFEKKFPNRFFNCGVAEQNMASVAAGLALEGKKVFFSSFAVFSPGRNWDQIRVNIAYNKLDIKFSGAHAGVMTGEDGATHQALEDIALMQVLPNIVVLVPADYNQAYLAAKKAASYKGPVYIRLGREKIPIFSTLQTPFEIGKANVLKDGEDLAIFATGVEVYEALKASKKLDEEKIDAAVIDFHTIKPLDKAIVEKYAKKCSKILICQEHQANGALVGAVAEFLVQKGLDVKVEIVAIEDKFGQSGSGWELLRYYGLDAENIYKKAKKLNEVKT